MIEIKFKAWSSFGKKMHLKNEKEEFWSFIRSVFGMELLQCTEVRDKNGYEIYEGDILKGHDGFIYRVWRVCGGFATNVHVEKFKKDINMDYPFPLQPLADEQTVSYFENSCEIIGNIYENPELLCQD